MRFPGNCLIVALAAVLKDGSRLYWKRNKVGRVHFYWRTKDGRRWEFYKRGASSRSYLQNAIYIGEIRETR